MFAIVGIAAWALIIGLSARRLGLAQHALLIVGILGIMAAQYFVFGPS